MSPKADQSAEPTMKVIPGPNATDLKFGFRVCAQRKILATTGKPAELRGEAEIALAKQFISQGYLQEVA